LNRPVKRARRPSSVSAGFGSLSVTSKLALEPTWVSARMPVRGVSCGVRSGKPSSCDVLESDAN
jgi:hypothetical protein